MEGSSVQYKNQAPSQRSRSSQIQVNVDTFRRLPGWCFKNKLGKSSSARMVTSDLLVALRLASLFGQRPSGVSNNDTRASEELCPAEPIESVPESFTKNFPAAGPTGKVYIRNSGTVYSFGIYYDFVFRRSSIDAMRRHQAH